MSICEKDMLVWEIKGILTGLKREVEDASYQLASDNITDMTRKISSMRMIIDRIEAKISDQCKNEENKDEYI